MHAFRHFGVTPPVTWSSLSVTLTLVFHKSLSIFCAISFSALLSELCSGINSLASNYCGNPCV